MEKCERLRYYALFVGKARGYEAEERAARPGVKREEALRRAIERAVGYCKEHDILTECWDKMTTEEAIMMTREWDWEEAVAVAKEDGIEEGMEKGMEKGLQKGRQEGWGNAAARIFQLLEAGHSLREVKEMVASPV